jgi:hypothetical protein
MNNLAMIMHYYIFRKVGNGMSAFSALCTLKDTIFVTEQCLAVLTLN